MLSIVVAGGGTGGHVYPGIALADAIVRRRPDATVVFVGTSRGIETRAVPAAGFPLETIDVLPWARTLGMKRFASPLSAVRAALQASAALKRRRPDAVVGMGGYASLPVAIAARRRRIPIVLHEQNTVPGRATRLAARLTQSIAVTFAASVRFFPGRDVRVVGNPLRGAIATLDRAALRAEAIEQFGLDSRRKTVLVFGGSQGARRLSEAARGLPAEWGGRTDRQALLIAGRGNAGDSQALVHEIEYAERMDLAYAAADLVVARSGAGIMEIACAGLPAVLVPYPYARDDHQAANARAMASAGAAVVVSDAEASAARIVEETERILSDPGIAASMAAASRAFAKPAAADDLAAWVIDVAEGKRA